MSYTNLTLLVSSFDNYSVCWEPFCHGLKKYWPEHPPLFFITNHLDAPQGTSLKLGDDQGWAKNLLHALELVPTDFVLYSQEDYWIQSSVNNQNIHDYLSYLECGLVEYIRLYPAPGPDLLLGLDERLGIIGSASEYRASLQMAIWRKETLKSLVNPDESPWMFEVEGSKRSQKYEDYFWCVTKRTHGIDYVFTAIVNGYWSEQAKDYSKRENIEVEFNLLPKKKKVDRISYFIRSKLYTFKKKFIKRCRQRSVRR